MPNVYDNPGRGTEGRKPSDQEKPEQSPQRTVGVYERPKRKMPSPLVLIIIALVLAVAIVVLYSRFANGFSMESMGSSVSSPACVSRSVGSAAPAMPLASSTPG